MRGKLVLNNPESMSVRSLRITLTGTRKVSYGNTPFYEQDRFYELYHQIPKTARKVFVRCFACEGLRLMIAYLGWASVLCATSEDERPLHDRMLILCKQMAFDQHRKPAAYHPKDQLPRRRTPSISRRHRQQDQSAQTQCWIP